MMALFRALDTRGQLEDHPVQLVGIDAVAEVYRIVEETCHHLLVDGMLVAEGIIGINGFLGQPLIEKHCILEVHIPHVGLAGVGIDDQPRIVLSQLHQGVLHRDDTAYHYSTLGIDDGRSLECLGEVVVHTLGYLSVLSGSEGRELATTVAGLIAQGAHLFKYFLSCLREFAQFRSLAEPQVRGVVLFLLDQVARAVAGISADIKGFLAFWGRSKEGAGLRIGIVITTSLEKVAFQVLAGVLSRQSQYRECP